MMRSALETGRVYARRYPRGKLCYAALVVDADHLWYKDSLEVEGFIRPRAIHYPVPGARVKIYPGDFSWGSTGVPVLEISGSSQNARERDTVLKQVWDGIPDTLVPCEDTEHLKTVAYLWQRDRIPEGFRLTLADPRWLVCPWEERRTLDR